jgi:hypothetical protein
VDADLHCLKVCTRTHFEATATVLGYPITAFAITANLNADLVWRFFKNHIDRKQFEKVVRFSSLGHPADVRAVDLKT